MRVKFVIAQLLCCALSFQGPSLRLEELALQLQPLHLQAQQLVFTLAVCRGRLLALAFASIPHESDATADGRACQCPTGTAQRAAYFLKEIIDHEGLERQRYRDARLHRIEAEEEMRKLSVSSKLNAEWVFLQHLHDIGHRTADRWLAEHFDDLGERTTWVPDFLLTESLEPAHLPEGAKREAASRSAK